MGEPADPPTSGPTAPSPASSPVADSAVGVRRVHPEPAAPTTVAEAYRGAVNRRGGDTTRPWVALCMVSSLDGAVAVDGASGPLGNPTDRDVLLTLRELADVVIVGAATARGEGYGAPRNGVRIGVVTNSGHVDLASELFTSGAGFVITTEQAHVGSNVDDTADASSVDVVRAGRHRVDLALALERLAEVVPGATRVHAEGGPTLNGALLDADLIDEVNLTVAPVLAGGGAGRVTAAAEQHLRRFELAHLLVDDDGYTFGRWVRSPDST